MAKILVEIDMGEGSAEDLKKQIEKNRDDYFPVGGNKISIDRMELTIDPKEDDFYLFELKGIID